MQMKDRREWGRGGLRGTPGGRAGDGKHGAMEKMRVPDPRESGLTLGRMLFIRIATGSIVCLCPPETREGNGACGPCVPPFQVTAMGACLSEGSGLQKLRLWLGRRSGNAVAAVNRLQGTQGCVSAL